MEDTKEYSYEYIILEYVCPSLGCIMAAAMCAAPIQDLRHALAVGTLGNLNPLPWVFMTGNCLGWCAYAYYTKDPFVLAANFPGLLLSLWLNQGAIKLQYLEIIMVSSSQNDNHRNKNDENEDEMTDDSIVIINNGDDDGNGNEDNLLCSQEEESRRRRQPQQRRPLISSSPESMIFVRQEVQFYRLLLVWSTVLIWVGWIRPFLLTIITGQESWIHETISFGSSAEIIGLVTNINLILFFGAPLTTILEVWKQRQSTSIHRPTMYMNLLTATFWTGYGFAQLDPIIIVPNGIGILLGVIQIILCRIFPTTTTTTTRGKEGRIPLRGESFEDDDDDDFDNNNNEDGLIMMTKVRTHRSTGSRHDDDDDASSQEGVDAELSDDDLELL